MAIRVIKNTFAGGEITDSLIGRTDLEKNLTGAAYIKNMMVERFGGLSNRPGSYYVGTTIDNTECWPIPFVFSDDQSYILLFSEGRMRIANDRGIVLKSRRDSSYKWSASGSGTNEYYLEDAGGGSPALQGVDLCIINDLVATEGVAGSLEPGTWGWGNNDAQSSDTLYVRLTDETDPDSKPEGYISSDVQVSTGITLAQAKSLRYTQSFDKLYLAHQDFAPKVITRYAHDTWGVAVHNLTPSLSAPEDFVGTWSGTGTPNRSSFYEVATVNRFEEESEPTPAVTVNTVFPWPADGQVALYWNAIRLLSKYTWTLSSSPGINEFYLELATGGDPGISEPYSVYENEGEMTRGAVEFLEQGEWDYADNDGLGYKTIYVRLSGVWPDPNDPTYYDGYLTIKREEGEKYRVYKNYRGYYGWVGDVFSPWYVDDNVEADVSFGPFIQQDPFIVSGDYPKATALADQRLVYAGTANDPQTVWLSYLAAYNNFGYKDPSSDADSIEVELASGSLEDIRWIVSGKELVMFTGSSSWVITKAEGSGTFTPDSTRFRRQEFDGISETVKPITVQKDILFVEPDNKHINGLFYGGTEFEGYASDDLTILAEHLFEGRTVVSWAYQEYPSSVVWCVLSDGTMVSLTFLRDQKVVAWARHTTDGQIEAVETIPTATGTDLYLIVKRTIDGSIKRFIEVIGDREVSREQDAYHVDCGNTYNDEYQITNISRDVSLPTIRFFPPLSEGDILFLDGIPEGSMTEMNDTWVKLGLTAVDDGGSGPSLSVLLDLEGNLIDTSNFTTFTEGGVGHLAADVISGLDHLEGEAVAIVGDGQIVANPLDSARTPVVVTNGSVTLPAEFATVHVGLPYEVEFKTLRVESSAERTIQTIKKSIPRVWLRVKNSICTGSFMGPDVNDSGYSTSIKQRQLEDWRQPTTFKTGDLEHQLVPQWNTEGQLYYRQIDPLPVTVLALIMDLNIGDR